MVPSTRPRGRTVQPTRPQDRGFVHDRVIRTADRRARRARADQATDARQGRGRASGRSTVFALAGAAPGQTVSIVLASLVDGSAYGTILPLVITTHRSAVHRGCLPAAEHVAPERGRHLRVGVPRVEPLRRQPRRLADADGVRRLRADRRDHDRPERARRCSASRRTTSGPARLAIVVIGTAADSRPRWSGCGPARACRSPSR